MSHLQSFSIQRVIATAFGIITLWAASAISIPAEAAPPDQFPTVFVSPAEVDAIRTRVGAGDAPWARAYPKMIASADRALGASARSVVDNGAPSGAGGDAHKYGSDAPYQNTDGVYSDVDREDYMAAIDMGNWIRDLGMAYAFSGEDRYARKCIDLLHHWAVDPSTRMVPSSANFGPHTAGFKGQNSIEHYITVPKMFYGASFVAGHPYWQQKGAGAEAAWTQWVRDFLSSMETRGESAQNNIGSWWVTARATAAALLGDSAALSRAFEDWRNKSFDDLEDRGTFQHERWRNAGLEYSQYKMKALILTAEIARYQGVDLYSYDADGQGPSLRRAYDHHVQYFLDYSKWQWDADFVDFNASDLAAAASHYEIAYSYWQDADHLAVVQEAGRPVRDRRILGWTSLTHANRFELNVSSTPVGDPVFSDVEYFGTLDNYQLSEALHWRVVDEDGDARLFLRASSYEPAGGDRLGAWAVASERRFGDMDFEVSVKSAENLSSNDAADYAVIFGWQDARNYYYFLANATAEYNELFRVVDGVREALGTADRAALAGPDWATLAVSRRGEHIAISVDSQTILEVDDATFGEGSVGVGAFNDSAFFDDISVIEPAEPVEPSADAGATDQQDAGAYSDTGARPDAGSAPDGGAPDAAAFADASGPDDEQMLEPVGVCSTSGPQGQRSAPWALLIATLLAVVWLRGRELIATRGRPSTSRWQ